MDKRIKNQKLYLHCQSYNSNSEYYKIPFMRRFIFTLSFIFITFSAFATISWMGNHSTGAQPNNSQTIHFYVEMYDNYAGCHAEVVINEGGTWIPYNLTQGANNGSNSTWTADINVKSISTAYYFRGWDDYGAASVYDNNGGGNHLININPTTKAGGDGNWGSPGNWCDALVPSSTTASYIIAHALTLNQNVSVGTLVIRTGITFTASDASPRILTITKSAVGSSTTLSNSGVWVNGTGGSTVVFSGAPGAGDANHAVSGTSAFQNITVNKTSGSSNVGVSFGAGTSVLGTIEIGSGGYVATAPPTGFYGSNAILKFNTGGAYNVELGDYTWSTTQVPNNITIGSGTVNLNANRTVVGTLVVNTGATLNIGVAVNLTLISNSSGTASVGPSAGTITGNVTVERYIGTDKRAWRLLSIPVTGPTIREAWAGVAANGAAPSGETGGSGTLITGHGYGDGATAATAGYDWFTGLGLGTTSSIRFYNSNTWASVTNTPNVLAAAGKQGYMLFVRGDRTVTGTGSGTTTLRPKGVLHIGTKTVTITDTYEMVGNPYAATIDVDAVYANSGNAAVIKRNFWVWDATLGTSGAYRSISWDGSSVYTMVGGTGTASEYLKVQSGQAFFVEKKDAGGSIVIEEANKIAGSSTPIIFRTTSINGPVGLLNVNLYKAAQLVDGTTVRFNEGYDRAATEDFDVLKLNNFNENLSVVRDSRYLSIESLPYPSNTDTVFLSFWNLAANDYSFRLNTADLGGKLSSAILIDRFTLQQTALDLTGANTDFAFSVTSDPASASLSRFIIVMKALVILPLNFTKLTATAKQTGIEVNWKTLSETGVRDFDVERSADGLLFSKAFTTAASNNASGKNYLWLDAQPTEGWNYYRIRSNDLAGQKQYSSIGKALWKNTGLITVYPKQTTDGKVTLTLKDLAAGNYGIVLTGTNGKQVYKNNLSHTGGNNSYVLNLRGSGRLLANGVYVLSITDAQETKTNFSIIIAN